MQKPLAGKVALVAGVVPEERDVASPSNWAPPEQRSM